MKSNRMRRINELIQREISSYCERAVVSELNCLLTITQVKTSADLRHAQVFFSVLGDAEDWNTADEALNRHRVEMQTCLASSVVLKYTPVLEFKPDPTLEEADRVFSIIDSLELPDKSEDDG